MTHMKLVTGNDPTLFEERLARTLATLPENVDVVGVEFDTTPTQDGGVHFAALLRLETR